MSEAPWYYSVYIGSTRDEIDDVLGPNAFKMTAEQIVEVLIGMGYTPDVLDPSREMLPTPGVTTTSAGRPHLFGVRGRCLGPDQRAGDHG